MKVEQENQRNLRVKRQKEWGDLDPRQRELRMLACKFQLFAVNGRNFIDINEFEMMVNDLCVPFKARQAKQNKTKCGMEWNGIHAVRAFVHLCIWHLAFGIWHFEQHHCAFERSTVSI